MVAARKEELTMARRTRSARLTDHELKRILGVLAYTAETMRLPAEADRQAPPKRKKKPLPPSRRARTA